MLGIGLTLNRDVMFLFYFKIQTCGNTLPIEAPAYSAPLKNISFYRRDIFYGKNQKMYITVALRKI